jgi:hypothetical protein
MILRIGHSITAEPAAALGSAQGSGQGAWQAFANSQQHGDDFAGCISQPAHAALAGRLAAALNPSIFGALTPEVIDTIGRHDAGWAQPDLAALECAGAKQPQSFLDYPAEGGVTAWRKSIREAEARSPLAGILTSRHFCLLAPRDHDPHHQAFVEEEIERRRPHEAASPLARGDLHRFTAALGFCDLLSLCLCSGLTGTVQMPLAHAADPASQHAPKVIVSLPQQTTSDQTIRFDQPIMPAGAVVYVDGWIIYAPQNPPIRKTLASHRFQWIVG